MHKTYYFSFLTLLLSVFFSACNPVKDVSSESEKLTELNDTYSKIPNIKAIRGYQDGELFRELQQRYASNLIELNKEVVKSGSKLVVIMLTPEETTRVSAEFIKLQCDSTGIDIYDLTNELKTYESKEITQVPFDTHWSKNGAQIIANLLTPIINKYSSIKSSVKYNNDKRPATFGDLVPSQNVILDGGKDLPYNLITNKQGLRMDYDLAFPKTKQTFLFLGDSQIYFPFLDNKDISSFLLQKTFPNKEFLNAGVIGYSMDDYVSLYKDKAKYAEPDVIFLFTNTNDIVDMFFTQRNRVGRNREGVVPSKIEEEFYKATYPAK